MKNGFIYTSDQETIKLLESKGYEQMPSKGETKIFINKPTLEFDLSGDGEAKYVVKNTLNMVI